MRLEIKLDRRVAKKAQKYFVTGVSMITSTGSIGKNVMAAEWTIQTSYDPVLIAVFVHGSAATLKSIRQTREFGVNVASDDQTSLVNIAGGYSRNEIDKLKVRNSFKLLKSKHIRSPLIAGSIINAECKLIMMKRIGDHTMIVGKVVSIKHDETKRPLVYHQGRYYRIGSVIQPFRQKVNVDKRTFDWFYKEANHSFVLKCAGVMVKSGKRILAIKHNKKSRSYETIPYVIPKEGKNYANIVKDYLKKIGLKVTLKHQPHLKRFILQNDKKIQRVNFVLFQGRLGPISSIQDKLKEPKTDPLLKAIAS